ncbi:MAG: hypothetical protein WC980_05445 [Candidatus Brocadiia bacterium]
MDEKILVQCNGCPAQYNVAKLQPGAKFKCAKCGTINMVPDLGAPEEAPAEQEQAPAPAPQRPVAPPRPTASAPAAPKIGTSKIKVNIGPKKTSKFSKPVTARTAAAGGEDNDMGGIQVKKSNKKLFIIIGAAVAVILIIIIIAMSGGPSKEELAAQEKEAQKTEKKDNKKEEKKVIRRTADDTDEGAEEKKTEEKKAEPVKEEKKAPKKVKFADFVDADVKKEIFEILQKMPNQKDDEFKQNSDAIKAKGEKAIPVLILAIGITEDTDDAKRIGSFASDILRKMAKWEDAPNVNPMIGKIQMNDFCEDWKEWYLEKYGPKEDTDK